MPRDLRDIVAAMLQPITATDQAALIAQIRARDLMLADAIRATAIGVSIAITFAALGVYAMLRAR